MIVTIKKSMASGEITAPSSKSMSHRLLIAAGLADGISRISGIDMSDDVSATIDALRAEGANLTVDGDTVIVTGCGDRCFSQCTTVNCRESGSTLRFFIPIAMTGSNVITFTGSGRLFSRPLDVYEDIAKEQKLLFKKDVERLTVCGALKSGEYSVRGDISSQFISGLIFALPLLSGDSVIKLIPPVVSRPYIYLTLDALSNFGISYAADKDTISISGGQRYVPADITVERDFSNAAFLEAFNLTGGSVKVKGLNDKSLQGDKIYRELFTRLIYNRDGRFYADISQCPDLGPILIAAMSICGGGTLSGIRRLRNKESNRVEAMRHELLKFGVDINVEENMIMVPECSPHTPEEILDPHGDHRIAMSLALLCSKFGGSIKECESVKKSYPAFWEDIRSLGVDAEIREG